MLIKDKHIDMAVVNARSVLKYNVNRLNNSLCLSKGVSLPDQDTKDIILQLELGAIPLRFHAELSKNGEKLT